MKAALSLTDAAYRCRRGLLQLLVGYIISEKSFKYLGTEHGDGERTKRTGGKRMIHGVTVDDEPAIEEPAILVTLSRGHFEISRHKFQMKLEEFANSLEKQGVAICAGTTFSPEFKRALRRGECAGIDVEQLLTESFSISTTQVAPVLAALAAWLAARNGRKVRLKIGDIEAEARTTKEVEKLLLRAKEFQQNAATNSATSKPPTDE